MLNDKPHYGKIKHSAGNDLSSPWRRRYLTLNYAAYTAAINDLRLKWVLYFCKFLANPTLTSNLTVSSESQWDIESNNVMSQSVWKYYQLFTHESNTFLFNKYATETNW